MFDAGDRQRSRNTFVGTPCWLFFFSLPFIFYFTYDVFMCVFDVLDPVASFDSII